MKNIFKLENLIIQVNIGVLHIAYVIFKYSIPKEITIIFQNGSNYDIISS